MIYANLPEAYKLLYEGAIAMAKVQANGICIDTEYTENQKVALHAKMEELRWELKSTDLHKEWEKVAKESSSKIEFTKDNQLRKVLYDRMGLKAGRQTDKGANSVDAATLRALSKDVPELKLLLEWRKHDTVLNTFLAQILREVKDGIIHPIINLHLIPTYRSCIAKGTKVLAMRNFKEEGINIEDIRKGDLVYCFDNDLNPKIREVKWAGETGNKEVIRIHYYRKGGYQYLDCTPEHRIRLVSGKYIEAQHSKKGDRLLAGSRKKENLNFTGHLYNGTGIREHRFIYESMIGPLTKKDLVHHINSDDLDHRPENLQKMTASEHARHHVDSTLHSEQGRKNRVEATKKGWREGKFDHIIMRGPDNHMWLGLSKFDCLRLLSKAGGKVKNIPHDLATFKKYLNLYGICQKTVKLRYDKGGEYISRGRLARLAKRLKRSEVSEILGHNHYKLLDLYDLYGLEYRFREASLKQPRGNHIITRIEYLKKKVDVYDLEVEEFHNFFASELCVHNSMQAPSFQNQPKRDEVQAQAVRTAFIPRKGRHLLEIDFSSVEVKAAICYHKDPEMIRYDTSPGADMHRDMAMQCFKLTRGEIGKSGNKGYGALRHIGKNGWTFAQFYGDVYMHCAKNMWDMAGATEAVLADGTKLRAHMKREGIGSLALFTDHLEQVEEDFWGRRFKIYTQWKDEVWDHYQEHGYVDLLTGFRCSDITERNKVINRPIQGTAFHWLLWSLTRLQEQFEKRKVNSLIIGQVHDSILVDAHPAEIDHVMELAEHIMTQWIKKHWPWIIVPLEVGAELGPRDGSWYDIREIKRKESGAWEWKKTA